MNSKGRKKAGVLKGYKRRGKRFVPPLMQLPSVNTSIGYVTNILPAAYARSDLFERRRLMDDWAWAAYLDRQLAKVVQLRR